jgi:hypothetical protein
MAGPSASSMSRIVEAKYYEGKSTIGSILVAVHTRSRRDQDLARNVLTSVIATDIAATSEAPLPTARA